ncbi:O-antigen ligase family protein [Micrococcus luteus]|uniref:O-antigen ligase family protein n=1 Tax=Micrococcus luteus TaxID=1270 RepID=UPI0034077E57
MAVGFFSALWSVNRLETITQSGTLAVFFLWLHLTTLKRWSRVGLIISDLRVAFWSVWSVVAAGFLAGQLGLLEPYSSYSGRYMGFFNNPNLTAMTAALSAAFGVVLGLRQRRWIMVASTSLLLYVVFESESRTSLLALAACFGFMMLRRWPVLALAVPVIAIMAPTFFRVFLSAPDEGALSRIASTSEDETLSGRRAGWVAALELLGDSRLGVGWGATREALSIEAMEGAGPNLSSIHNSYLQNIYELGWIGAIASLLIVILLTVFVVLTRRPGAYDPLVSVVIVGSIISLAESPLFGVGQVFPYIFWTAYFGALCLSARAGKWVDKTDPR